MPSKDLVIDVSTQCYNSSKVENSDDDSSVQNVSPNLLLIYHRYIQQAM